MDVKKAVKNLIKKRSSNSLDYITKDSDKIEKSEKKIITEKLEKLGMDGKGRFDKVVHALNKIDSFLEDMSLELDWDGLDYYRIDNAEKGSYLIKLNRKTRDKKIEIKNKAIKFTWDLLGNINEPKYKRKYEILAYVT
jgi:hypothetical protein